MEKKPTLSSWIQTKNGTWIERVPKSESSKEDGGYVKIKEEHYYEARPFGWVPQEHQESPENHEPTLGTASLCGPPNEGNEGNS